MGRNNCFSKIIANILLPWHWVNTHLNAPGGKTSAFIEVLTLAEDELCIIMLRDIVWARGTKSSLSKSQCISAWYSCLSV